LLRARGARDYQPAAEVLPVGEALPPRPRQVNRLLEKLGRAKCPIIGAGRGVTCGVTAKTFVGGESIPGLLRGNYKAPTMT
jgi:thiamine pyrophosphate-dependent acetolactate synthase large subunit-like protein